MQQSSIKGAPVESTFTKGPGGEFCNMAQVVGGVGEKPTTTSNEVLGVDELSTHPDIDNGCLLPATSIANICNSLS